MAPNSLTSVIIPRAMLVTGLAFAIHLISAHIVDENRARHVLAVAYQEHRPQTVAYERCAADLKKTGKYGEMVDLVADAWCPEKPNLTSIDSFNRSWKRLRANALEHAGIVALLASLP